MLLSVTIEVKQGDADDSAIRPAPAGVTFAVPDFSAFTREEFPIQFDNFESAMRNAAGEACKAAASHYLETLSLDKTRSVCLPIIGGRKHRPGWELRDPCPCRQEDSTYRMSSMFGVLNLHLYEPVEEALRETAREQSVFPEVATSSTLRTISYNEMIADLVTKLSIRKSVDVFNNTCWSATGDRCSKSTFWDQCQDEGRKLQDAFANPVDYRMTDDECSAYEEDRAARLHSEPAAGKADEGADFDDEVEPDPAQNPADDADADTLVANSAAVAANPDAGAGTDDEITDTTECDSFDAAKMDAVQNAELFKSAVDASVEATAAKKKADVMPPLPGSDKTSDQDEKRAEEWEGDSDIDYSAEVHAMADSAWTGEPPVTENEETRKICETVPVLCDMKPLPDDGSGNATDVGSGQAAPPDDTSKATYIGADGVLVRRQMREEEREGMKNPPKRTDNQVAYIQREGFQPYFMVLSKMKSLILQVFMFLLLNGFLVSGRIVFLTDGAKDIRKAVNAQFEGYEYSFLLDWYHLVKKCREYLSTAIKGKSDGYKAQVLLVLKYFFWRGQGAAAIYYLKHLNKDIIRDQEKLEQLIEYLERNRPYIPNYMERRRLGMPITSTSVESANNTLVASRQKNDGMSWSPAGSLTVASFKALQLNDEFDCWFRTGKLKFRMRKTAA